MSGYYYATWAPRSDDVIREAATDVMVALLDVYQRTGRATVRDVAARCERSVSTVHAHLHWLQLHGLVDLGTKGGLRPLVRTVAMKKRGRR